MNTHTAFRQRVGARDPQPHDRWCVFVGQRLLVVQHGDRVQLPTTQTLALHEIHPSAAMLLGELGDQHCLLGSLHEHVVQSPLTTIDVRTALGALHETEATAAGYASQIAHWDETSRFCPRCATPTEPVAHERAKRCPNCHLTQYPRVHPAIIVLVYRPGEVLLTRQATWPAGRYSLIAGFVEPGETLEACVRREVSEEVGVLVDEIRYLGSQPWPFPHQIMVGFVARYADGDVQVDHNELEDARWFAVDDLPLLPPPISIARKIFDWYAANGHDATAPFPP